MYFSFVEFEHKQPIVRPSSVIMNPEIIREHVKQPLSETIIKRRLAGELYKRGDKKQAWKVMLNHSYRHEGKVKKIQLYLETLDYWQVIDHFIQTCSHDNINSKCIIPTCKHRDKITTQYPDIDESNLSSKIEEAWLKFEKPIIEEFKLSDEYPLWIKQIEIQKACWQMDKADNQKLKTNRAKRAKNKVDEEREYQERFWDEAKEQQGFDIRKTLKQEVYASITIEQAELILNGYHSLAKQYHPDKNGNHDDMIKLNDLKDSLERQIKAAYSSE